MIFYIVNRSDKKIYMAAVGRETDLDYMNHVALEFSKTVLHKDKQWRFEVVTDPKGYSYSSIAVERVINELLDYEENRFAIWSGKKALRMPCGQMKYFKDGILNCNNTCCFMNVQLMQKCIDLCKGVTNERI